MFQVAFDLPQESATWPPFSTERIWAKKTSAPYQLEVQSVPFFVRDLSRGDIIRAKPDHERRELVFDGLVRHSGHSTIRVILRDKTDENRDRVLEMFRAAGSSWEFTSVDFHFAVDLPGEVDYRSLRSMLVEATSTGAIEVEEAFVAPAHVAQLDA
ncbi:DUF4265 domain-containing protein [Actinoplanes sp. LDG1-06]|uniref:DUF4265 domain-containing protein n=2 Tax=Paractinoplanes ovalisporus TaxID=2810368 RepID=A0ABS2A7H5_9ACTN|nr:DUF4265 domain-containing protein [Actinoplanes ovalisporus]